MYVSWLMIGAATFAAPAEPIPAGQAFKLPPALTSVADRSLTFSLRAQHGTTWEGATVKVGGKRFATIGQAAAQRPIKLRLIPRGKVDLAVSATTADHRTATVERTYQTCIDKAPVIAAPTGTPPTTLRKRELVKGGVSSAKAGDDVTVEYRLVRWADGKTVDSSWTRGEPFEFELGAGQVIDGFDLGVVGMKVGGRREVVIPPDLGYGDQGSGPIEPGDTLVFVIDLVAITKRS